MSYIIFPDSEKSHELAIKYNFKEWMIARYLSFIPDIEKFLDYINNRKPNQYIRINTLKIDVDSLKQKLLEKDFILEQTQLQEVFLIVESKFPIGATMEYLSGYYYIQDLSSCFAVESLDIKESDRVLDMVASPGGKTSFIAQKMNNNGVILAVESINIGADSLLQFGDKVMDNSIKFTRRFYPHIHNTNGFFIAKIRVNNT